MERDGNFLIHCLTSSKSSIKSNIMISNKPWHTIISITHTCVSILLDSSTTATGWNTSILPPNIIVSNPPNGVSHLCAKCYPASFPPLQMRAFYQKPTFTYITVQKNQIIFFIPSPKPHIHFPHPVCPKITTLTWNVICIVNVWGRTWSKQKTHNSCMYCSWYSICYSCFFHLWTRKSWKIFYKYSLCMLKCYTFTFLYPLTNAQLALKPEIESFSLNILRTFSNFVKQSYVNKS